MAYIGQQPVVGRYILLDQISGGFNGTTSGFTMSTAGGVQGVKPGLAQNVLLSLGGVIQQPGVDYTISGSGITFTTPPVSGTTFFATVLGDAQSVGTPSDGTVTPASIAAGYDFAFPNVNVTGVTTIASGSAATPSLSVTGDSDTGFLSPAVNTIAVSTSGGERLRIDSSGRLLVGASSDFTNGTGTKLQSIDSSGGQIALGRDSSSLGNGLLVGRLRWYGNSGGTAEEVARISVEADNTHALGDKPGRLTFHTTADNASSPTERMRINSSGNVGIGTSSPANTLHVDKDTGATPTVYINNSGTDSGDGVALKVQASQRGTGIADASVFSVHNNASEIFTVRNDGNVGIGTSSPGRDLDVVGSIRSGGSTNPFYALADGTTEAYFEIASSVTRLSSGASQPLVFRTGSTERMRIDSSGRLLINHSASRSVGSARIVQIEGTSNTTAGVSLLRNSNDANSPTINLGKSRGTSTGSNTIVQDGDGLGSIYFRAADGTDINSIGASIDVGVDGTPGSNDTPGRIMFGTTSDGASSPTERLRIDSSGNVGIGTTSPGQLLHVSGASAQALVAASSGVGKIRLTRGTTAFEAYTSTSACYVGTTSNTDFQLRANNAERMRIKSSGNVGIGTTSPNSKLTVRDNSGSLSSTKQITADFRRDDGSSNPRLEIRHFNQGSDIHHTWSSGASNLTISIGNNETARFLSSGGMTFGGDTAAANALDDYEEGTFVPAFQSGITSPTFTTQNGNYTKIGSLVTFTIHINLSGGTNTSSQIIITDLPFTSNQHKQAGAATFAYTSGLSNDSGWPTDNNPTLYIGPNSNKIYFYADNGGTWNGDSGGGLSGRNIHIAGHYFV